MVLSNVNCIPALLYSGNVTDESIGGIPLQGLTEISGEAGGAHAHIPILDSAQLDTYSMCVMYV